MSNPEIYKYGKRFTSKYQPKNRGRKPGSIDIKVLLEKIFNKEIEVEDLTDTQKGKVKKRLIELGLELQYQRWANGDTAAGKDLLDRYYGKPTEKHEIEAEHTVTFKIVEEEKDI